MKLGTDRELLQRIVESLRLVAAPADEQIAAMTALKYYPDEVAMTLEESCAFIPRLKEAGLVGPELEKRLAQIDQAFVELSGEWNKEFWTLEAMRQDPRWERMRELAAEVLAFMGYEKRPPDIYWDQIV